MFEIILGNGVVSAWIFSKNNSEGKIKRYSHWEEIIKGILKVESADNLNITYAVKKVETVI